MFFGLKLFLVKVKFANFKKKPEPDPDLSLKDALVERVDEFFDEVKWFNFHRKKNDLIDDLEELIAADGKLGAAGDALIDDIEHALDRKWVVLCNKNKTEKFIEELICDVVDDPVIDPGNGDCPPGEPAGTDAISGTPENDVLTAEPDLETTIAGNPGDDTIVGSNFDDFLLGNPGDDDISGNCGDDDLRGGSENDELFGDNGNDSLAGDSGDDTLDGGAGDDRISGGRGADELFGGEGKDTFVFTSITTDDPSVDTIMDFEAGSDLIAFEGIAQGDVTVTQVADDTEISVNGILEVVVLDADSISVADAFTFDIA